MPYIIVESFEGKSIEQKRKLAKEMTKLMVEIFEAREQGVRVIFKDVKKQDFAIGGRIWSDIEKDQEKDT